METEYKYKAVILKDGVLQIQANLDGEPKLKTNYEGISIAVFCRNHEADIASWQSKHKYIAFASKEDETKLQQYVIKKHFNTFWSADEHYKAGIQVDCIEIKSFFDDNNVEHILAYFKAPNEVEERHPSDNLLNTFGNYCVINGIKLTDSNKVAQAVIDFLQSEYYLNRK